MRHILPPNPVKKIYEPRLNKKMLRRSRRNVSGRQQMFRDHYADPQKLFFPMWAKITMLIIGVVLIGQSIFHVPFLRIENVNISGMKYLSEEEVRSYVDSELLRRRWIIFKNNNYLLVSLSRMRQRLENEYFLKVIELKKDFPDTLNMVVEERIAGFVLQTPDKYIQIDTRAEWIGEVFGPTGYQSVILDERANVGTEIPTSYLEKATLIKEFWESNSIGLKLAKFHLTDDDTRIEVSTDKPFRIYLHPEKDFESQLRRLAIFIQEANLEDPGEYIDLRFDEKLFIR